MDLEPVTQARSAPKRPILLLLTCIGIACFKLWLVDGLGNPSWFANEWLLLGAAGFFCAALATIGVSSVSVPLAYALLVFEPNSLLASRDLLPTGFSLPVSLFGMAALVLSASARRFRGMAAFGCLAGLAFGLLWEARPERSLLWLPVGVMAGFDLLAGRRLGEAWRPLGIRFGLLLLVPFAAGALVAGALSFANVHSTGVFAIREANGSGYRVPPRVEPDAKMRERATGDESLREDRLRRTARKASWLSHSPGYAALTAAGLLAALTLARPRRRDRFCDPAIGAMAMLLAWVIARIALLVLVDGSSSSAEGSRDIHPVGSLYACAMLLLVEQALRNVPESRANRRTASSAAPRGRFPVTTHRSRPSR